MECHALPASNETLFPIRFANTRTMYFMMQFRKDFIMMVTLDLGHFLGAANWPPTDPPRVRNYQPPAPVF